MPIYILVDGMGPSDRISFAVEDTQLGDFLESTASVAFGEHIGKSE
jgi:hypothetical protein